MTINSLISIIAYSCWRVWIIKDRTVKFNIAETPVTTVSEVCYTLLMIYLLTISSTIFLSIALFSLFIHCAFGFYVELFKPEQRMKEAHKENILEKFWYFLLVDTAITLGCFLVMINFSG